MDKLYAPAAELWDRVTARIDVQPNGCWIFTGALNSSGYACTSAGASGRTILAHRLAIIVRDGDIPDGMTVDHLCFTPACVNPEHLEVVSNAENRARAVQYRHPNGACTKGHELTPRSDGRGRRCRVCQRAYKARYLERVAAVKAGA